MATVYFKRSRWYVGFKDDTGRRQLVRTIATGPNRRAVVLAVLAAELRGPSVALVVTGGALGLREAAPPRLEAVF